MKWRSNIMLKRSSVICVLFLLICQMEVYSTETECPDNCNCEYDDKEATCLFANSSVHIIWEQNLDYIQEDPDDVGSSNLYINCEGTEYNCTGIPKLDILPRRVTINITSCSPEIVSCVNSIYHLSNNLESVYMYDVKNFEKNDFVELPKFRLLYINIKNDSTLVPLEILPNASAIIVNGGRVSLYPHMFTNTQQEFNSLQIENIYSLPDDSFNGLSKLKSLSIEYNEIAYIPAAALRGLAALESFLISSSRLEMIEPTVFTETKNLISVYFGDGCLTALPNELLRPLKYLGSVTIYNNSKHIDFGDRFFAKPALEYLEITKSGITTLPETLLDSTALTYLYFTHNKLTELPPKIFWNVPKLSYVYCNGNRIRKLHKDTFSKLKYLVEIDFRDNYIDELSRDLFIYNLGLKFIKLDNNNIVVLDLFVVKGLNIFALNIPSNKIQTVVGSPSLSLNIRVFDLSGNNIKEFGDLVGNYNKISLLNITGNQIEVIEERQLQNFSSSTIIDLSYNKLSTIIINKNNSTNSQIHAQIYLAHNRFGCECNTITILQKLGKANVLKDYFNISCDNVKEKVHKIQQSSICNKMEILIAVIGSSAVALLIFVLLIIAIITQRNKIIKKFSNLWKNPDNLEIYQMKLDNMKTNDVFISFAHEDVNFVNDILLPKLEKDFNQKVCVHYRDWIVGQLIPDQIIKSVEDSRITILILTKHFIESEWSYLEFRTAYNICIQEARPKVIVIIQNETVLTNKKLNDVLKSYIVDNGYLLFNNNDFWPKLKSKLPRKGKALKL